MNFFIGLVFDNNSEHLKKIDNYRRRFDYKYLNNSFNQLTILPPFELENSRVDNLNRIKENLVEIVDDHLFGDHQLIQFEFYGISLHPGKKTIIGLTPKYTDELSFLQESLIDYLISEGAKFNKKNTNNLIYPIGRFENDYQIEVGVEIAKLEFSSPFVLNSKSIALFQRQNCIWNLNNELFKFQSQSSLNFVNQLWPN